jgi:hypothetical protein
MPLWVHGLVGTADPAGHQAPEQVVQTAVRHGEHPEAALLRLGWVALQPVGAGLAAPPHHPGIVLR